MRGMLASLTGSIFRIARRPATAMRAALCSLLVSGCASAGDFGYESHLLREARSECAHYLAQARDAAAARRNSLALVVILYTAGNGEEAVDAPTSWRFVTLSVLSELGGHVPLVGVVHTDPQVDELGHVNLSPLNYLLPGIGLLGFEERAGNIWSTFYVACGNDAPG